jgi:5-methylcytosine-specific restriction protein A
MNYKDKRWEHKREVILRRDEYLCQESKRYGKTVAATTVHHIYPAEFYPDLAYVNWNLISLSDSKHNTMHDRDTHELTDKGKALQLRVKDKFDKYMQNKQYPPT